MTPLYQFLALLTVHWVADFILQTDWQAKNKSKRNDALGRHVGVYTLALALAAPLIFGWNSPAAIYFVLVNGALHFATDWCTSRVSSRLYAKGDVHNFFIVVGLDQLIHQFTLAATMVAFLYPR
mgnify:CR=1 FL=1